MLTNAVRIINYEYTFLPCTVPIFVQKFQISKTHNYHKDFIIITVIIYSIPRGQVEGVGKIATYPIYSSILF